MSRIGILPIAIPAGVTVSVDGGDVAVRGPLGECRLPVPGAMKVAVDDGTVVVSRPDDEKQSRAMHGTVRSLVANMVEGVSRGFQRNLVIEGVGYRAILEESLLILNLGYSHPIRFEVPEGIDVKLEGQTGIVISGIDKQQVGQVAARIRAYAPAEPYKGKGVRYKDEQIRRKVGKAVG